MSSDAGDVEPPVGPNERAVVIMAKQPEPGRTKTRLSPALRPEAAAELSRCFLLDTVTLASSVPAVDVIVAAHPPSAVRHLSDLVPGVPVISQHGAGLGDRLDYVITAVLASGYRQVAALGSDSPTLPAEYISAAFGSLAEPSVDVVLGPTDDGGYYLIAVERPPGRVVTDVEMSTPRVLDDTVALARRLELGVAVSKPWYDVDEPPDLLRLTEELRTVDALSAGVAPRTARFLAASSASSARRVAVVVPARDEAENIAEVVRRARGQPVEWVVVADNGSLDDTADRARAAGAIVVSEPRPGYGYACAAGSAEAERLGADIIVYLDGDLSSPPEEIPLVLDPVKDGLADLVLGSRVRGRIAPGAMAPHQRFGNWLSARLMRALYDLDVSDLGPFRAIRVTVLQELRMSEMTFGWPTEMTVKAARIGARIHEAPVTWLARPAGRSKVSGTVRGSVLAGRHILGVTLRHAGLAARARSFSRRVPARR